LKHNAKEGQMLIGHVCTKNRYTIAEFTFRIVEDPAMHKTFAFILLDESTKGGCISWHKC
jgi:hypothetical protein